MQICEHSLDELRSRSELGRSLFDWWRETGGVQRDKDDWYASIVPFLQLSVFSEEYGLVYYYVGRETTSAKVFGSDWAANAIGAPGVPDRKLENAVRFAYEIGRHKPYFDTVGTLIETVDGLRYLEYDRLILPHRLITGADAVITFTEFAHAPIHTA